MRKNTGMRTFPTREQALSVSRGAIENFARRHEVCSTDIGAGTDEWLGRLQKTSIVTRTTEGSLNLLHVYPPTLFDVPSKGKYALSRVVLISDDMLVETQYRPKNKKSQGPRKNKRELPVFATPIIWPDQSSDEPSIKRLESTTDWHRPAKIMKRFTETVSILPSELHIGDQLEISLYNPADSPIQQVPTTHGLGTYDRLDIEGKKPVKEHLGMIIGLSVDLLLK
jgi:hypothetical protein